MKKYYFNIDEFRKNLKLVENIYNLAFVLDLFCKNNQEDENIWHITTIVESIKNNSDTVLAKFIEKE